MRTMLLAALVLLLCVFVSPSHSAARTGLEPDKPLLHGLFTDNMVLQRGIAVPVWGWAAPGQRVTVSLHGAGLPLFGASINADAAGKWITRLGPLRGSGPYTLTVQARGALGAQTATGTQIVTRTNVLVGDVWICSGQSNMEWPVAASNNAQTEIAAANYPQIRLFTVPKTIATEPRRDVQSRWQVCSPATVGDFSAVGYFFGRHLNRDLKVPIGLIDSSWGGTVAEAWVSAGALRTMPDFRPALDVFDQNVAALKNGNSDFDRLMAEWWTNNDRGTAARWETDFDDSTWKTMSLPQPWEGAGLPAFDGLVWFRRTFELPANWAGQDLTLRLGAIDDRDTTWVNGVPVGQTNEYNAQRVYRVPAGVLRAGHNTIAVRVLDTGATGGFAGTAEQMRLEGPAGSTPISLAGEWKYQASTPLAQTTPVPQRLDNNPNTTTVLYNGMIAPLVPYGIKGALWYQGESNASRAVQYQTLLPTLIRDWRARFGVGEFPFFIVQLANFMAVEKQPSDPPWAHLREAQALTARNLPNTGLALAIDIGEAGDIHPRNKQEVGRRLALAARGIAYRQPITYAGPTYRTMRREVNAIRLFFDHAEGLTAKDIPGAGGSLRGFAIAGANGRFVWADARIDGNSVVVSSPQVPNPSAVRYAWANNPVANLYNRAGLPAAPFRTDKDAG